MSSHRAPIVPFDAENLVGRLARAAKRLGLESVEQREMEHLVGVVTRCSALLEDVYTDDRLRAVLGSNPRRLAALLAAPWFRLPVAGDLPLIMERLRRMPDRVRQVGDQALFDVAISGRSQIHGVPLDDLGPKAYVLAADVLDMLADDARLREHFVSNRLGRPMRIEDEIGFLRRCAERFDLYAKMLREAGDEKQEASDSPKDREGLVLPTRTEPGTRSGDPRGIAAGRSDPAAEPTPSPERPDAARRADRRPHGRHVPRFAAQRLPREQLLSAYERLLLFSRLDLEQLRCRLSQIVIDQDEAIETLCDDFALYAVGTQNLTRPASYFLVGPTGVGKNYLVETLVQSLEVQWQLEVPLLMIEGPNYTYPADINELRGATRGFIRSDEPGLLTEFHKRAVRAPLSLILVDEVEKAHPQLRRFFLSVMDRGTTTDAQGNELSFAGTLLFFTSNIGYKDRSTSAKPIGFGDERDATAAYDSELSRVLRRALSPEFTNRLKIVRFRHLPRESARRILRLEFRKIAERYDEVHGIEVSLSPRAEDMLLERGYSHEYGARRLASMLQRRCNVEIGKLLRRDAEAAGPDQDDLLERLRELKLTDTAIDFEQLDREILVRARARVPYRRILVEERDGEIVFVREGLDR
ncbi:MAG: ATP-dependent Clp protease ATP-binding subunit [Acidobacteriota bacterium]|nr:MAG: ATP-dependent Clp protease ATP-binding subunit [Acidobacteriota bacterium]